MDTEFNQINKKAQCFIRTKNIKGKKERGDKFTDRFRFSLNRAKIVETIF